jgi:CheY-specific phosphatase CheX
MEVLGVCLPLPTTLRNSSSHGTLSDAPDQITSTVLFAGQRLTGSVHLHLPLAFVAQAVRRLTGLDGAGRDADVVLNDAAGELANMVAGRVAAQLAADGYPCKLGTPSVFRSAGWPAKKEPGMDHKRIEVFCDGHSLSLEVQCRYANP